ncbi:MAG: hypothetical protein JO110_24090, partial [Acetobacteraceae bacterium]|nr:hypothetical protein [Acetobacteraceae bacterium]
HSKMRLIGISQSDRVESWGLGGYGDAAENFLTVYLGEKATQKVPGLIGAKWPMAVEWRGRVEGLDMHGVLGIAQEPIDGGRLFVLPGVETMPPVDGKGRQQRRERPARFAAGEGGNEWTRQTGPRGASYWVSSRTGRKVYRDTMPGEHDHAGADEPEPGYHRPPTGDLQWVHEHKHAAETHPALGQIAAANEQIIGLLTSDLKPRQKQQQLREVWRGLSTEFKGACLQAATAAAAELAQLTGKPVEKFEGLKNRARIFAAQVLDYLKDDINDATHTLWRSGEDAYPEIKRNAGLDLHMIEHAFYSDVPSEAMSDGKAEQQLQILEKHFLGAARTPEQRQEATEAWILYQGDMRRPAASRAIASQPLRTMTPTANVPERFAAEYHGPTPPSPDWTLVRTGPRGGKVWAPPKAKAATHGYRPDEVAAMSPAQRRMLAGLTHKEEARGKTDAEVQELLAGGEPATAATTDPADHNRQANELLRAIAHGRETGTPDPRGDLAHLPGTDTLNRSLAAIDAAVVRHFQAKGANIPLADLYAEIAPQTGLTPEAFRAVLLHANQVQRYRFSGWPRMPEDHPRPELLPVASGKALGSVGPADQTQHVQAPASTPVASPAAAPATERPSLFNEAPSPDAGQPLTGKTEVRGDDLRAALQLQRQGKLSVSDRYRDVKVPRVEKGQTVHGDPIYGHEYTPDAFILSDATGRPIRHYVTLANGARVHPDELARLKVGKDGQVSLAPDEGLTVIDPVNRGKMRVKSFGRALANVGSYLTGPHDPVTIQSPHGYTVTKPRASWQKEWNESRTLGGPKHGLSFAEWFDRQPTDQAQPDPGEAVPVKPKPPVSAPGFFGGNTVPNRGLFDRFGRREDPEGYERSKSSGSGSCTWITIGAHEGHGGKRSGGSPVCIGKDGRIAKGHPKFTGKKIAALSEKGDARSKPSQHHHLKKQLLQHLDTGEADVGTLQRLTGDKHEPGSPLHEALHELQQSGHVNLHQPRHGPAVVAHTGKVFDEPESEAESPEPSHRQQLAQSRAYERAIWAKKARKSGLKGEHLHQLAAEILAHDREFKKDRTRLLKDARQLSESQGYGSLDTLKARASRGIDADAVRGLDDVAQSVAAKYPEEFNGHEDDLPGRLYDLLLGGNPEPLSEDEAYSEAFDRLTEHQREEERRKRVPATTGFGAAERDRREWKQHRVEQGEEVPFRRSELAKQYERLASEMELLAQKFLSIYSRHS